MKHFSVSYCVGLERVHLLLLHQLGKKPLSGSYPESYRYESLEHEISIQKVPGSHRARALLLINNEALF